MLERTCHKAAWLGLRAAHIESLVRFFAKMQSKVELAQRLIAEGKVEEARELLRQHYASKERAAPRGCCPRRLR